MSGGIEGEQTADSTPEQAQEPAGAANSAGDEAKADRKARKRRERILKEAAEKQKRALELRIAGMNYRQVAEAAGYASPGAAHRAVREALEAIPREAAKELLALQNEQLAMLRVALVQEARRGDPNAIDRFLKVMDHEAKLNGLYTATLEDAVPEVAAALAGFLAAAKAVAGVAEEPGSGAEEP